MDGDSKMLEIEGRARNQKKVDQFAGWLETISGVDGPLERGASKLQMKRYGAGGGAFSK